MKTWNELRNRCENSGQAHLPEALRRERLASIHGGGNTQGYQVRYEAELRACLGVASAHHRIEAYLEADTVPLVLDLPGGGSLTLLAMAPWHPLAWEARQQRLAFQAGDVLCLAQSREFLYSHSHTSGWSIWRPTRVDDWPVESLCHRAFGEEPAPPAVAKLVASAMHQAEDTIRVNLVTPGGLDAWKPLLGSLPPAQYQLFVASKLVEDERAYLQPVKDCASYLANPPKADLTILGGLSRTRLRLLPASVPEGWSRQPQPGRWSRCFRPPLSNLPLRQLVNQLGAAMATGKTCEEPLGLEVHVPAGAQALVQLARLHSHAILIADPLLEAHFPDYRAQASKPQPLYLRTRQQQTLNAAQRRPRYGPEREP